MRRKRRTDLRILPSSLPHKHFPAGSRRGSKAPPPGPAIPAAGLPNIQTGSCQARIRNGTFYLLIKNSFVTPVRRKGGRFLSVRHEGYGVGTESARTVAENYGGSCVFEEKEGIFVVSVMFLLQENMIPGKMPEEQL